MTAERWQRLPPLSREEYAALKSSIEEAGVLVPVERDMAGDVLDGHHRLRALNELRADGHVLPDAPAIVRSPIGKSTTMKRSYHIFAEGDETSQEAARLLRELAAAGLEPGEDEPALICIHDARALLDRARDD
jgi:ParB-like chromosome segregation protein Spo0J